MTCCPSEPSDGERLHASCHCQAPHRQEQQRMRYICDAHFHSITGKLVLLLYVLALTILLCLDIDAIVRVANVVVPTLTRVPCPE
jgi:hypothetical protein